MWGHEVEARDFAVLARNQVYCNCGRIKELYVHPTKPEHNETYEDYEPCGPCMNVYSDAGPSYASPVFVFENGDNNPDPYFTCRYPDEDEDEVKVEELYWVYSELA